MLPRCARPAFARPYRGRGRRGSLMFITASAEAIPSHFKFVIYDARHGWRSRSRPRRLKSSGPRPKRPVAPQRPIKTSYGARICKSPFLMILCFDIICAAGERSGSDIIA